MYKLYDIDRVYNRLCHIVDRLLSLSDQVLSFMRHKLCLIKFNPWSLRLKSRSVEQVMLEVEHLTQKLTVIEQT